MVYIKSLRKNSTLSQLHGIESVYHVGNANARHGFYPSAPAGAAIRKRGRRDMTGTLFFSPADNVGVFSFGFNKFRIDKGRKQAYNQFQFKRGFALDAYR